VTSVFLLFIVSEWCWIPQAEKWQKMFIVPLYSADFVRRCSLICWLPIAEPMRALHHRQCPFIVQE